MATRQYIGARYVPKFYQNSVDGSTQWESNVVYDPMIWVTLQNGHIYLSKKEVPATIGTPAQNIGYWLDVGSYDGYIASLQEQINDMKDGSVEGSLQYQINTLISTTIPQVVSNLENEISSAVGAVQAQVDLINADNIICIGDSYAVDATAGGNSWATFVAARFGARCHVLVQGGTGFATDVLSSSSPNWLSMLTAYANTLSTADKAKVKHIVVMGGANDGNMLFDGTVTREIIQNRITSFLSYCATTFPNAMVKLAFIGWHRQNQRYDSYNQVRDDYAGMILHAKNGSYYAGGEPIMHNSSFINSTDLIHPTQSASNRLGDFAVSMINGGNWVFEFNAECGYTKASGINNVSNVTGIYATYVGNICQLEWIGSYSNNTYIDVSLAYQDNITVRTGDAIGIVNLTNSPMGSGVHSEFIPVHCLAGVYGGDTVEIDGLIGLQQGALIYKHVSATVDISNILIPWGSLTLNLRRN